MGNSTDTVISPETQTFQVTAISPETSSASEPTVVSTTTPADASQPSCKRHRTTWKHLVARIFWASALLAFLVGIFAPCYTITPTFGDPVIDAMMMNYRSGLMTPRTFSIVSSVRALFQAGDIALGIIILLFSVAFPVVKLVLLSVLLFTNPNTHKGMLIRFARWFLSMFGHWSMLDVFVVAVIIVGFKALPLGATISRDWGLFCFGASVLLGSGASSFGPAYRNEGAI